MVAKDANGSTLPWLKSYPDFADWSMPLPATPVFNLLHVAAEKFPKNVCMEFLGRQWTYTETRDLSNKAAKGFQELGVGQGTRVGLLLPNTPYYIAAFFGATMAGGTVVNMNPLYPVRELETMVTDGQGEVVSAVVAVLFFPAAAALNEASAG